jgi:predicted Zn-dependent protease
VNRWTSGRAGAAPEDQRMAEFWEAMDFADACPDPYFVWATFSVLREHLVGDTAATAGTTAPWVRTPAARKLMRLLEPLADLPGLSYASRYEHAALLCAGGDAEKGRAAFTELYRQTLKDRGLPPPIDTAMVRAFEWNAGGNGSGTGIATQPAVDRRALWAGLIHEAATTLAGRGDRAAIVDLTRQCHDLGDAALANELIDRALGFAAAPERFDVTLAAVQLLADTREFARADEALRTLLDDPKYGRIPELWRLASVLAGRQGRVARSLACRERAMALEFEQDQQAGDLPSFRKEYGDLLAEYEQLASAVQALESEPPRDVVQQVVRAADRWRAVDPDPTAACQAAARTLKRLGAADLAWDYLTTPLAGQSTESAAWQKLAEELAGQQDFALADRAYATAFEAEPTNAQLLWDRAEMLQRWGKADQSRQIRRQIAQGEWQPRFASLQERAVESLKR